MENDPTNDAGSGDDGVDMDTNAPSSPTQPIASSSSSTNIVASARRPRMMDDSDDDDDASDRFGRRGAGSMGPPMPPPPPAQSIPSMDGQSVGSMSTKRDPSVAAVSFARSRMDLSNHDGGSRRPGDSRGDQGHHQQQQQHQQQAFDNPASDMAGAVIWGTTVNVEESMQTFRQFVRNYRNKNKTKNTRARRPTNNDDNDDDDDDDEDDEEDATDHAARAKRKAIAAARRRRHADSSDDDSDMEDNGLEQDPYFTQVLNQIYESGELNMNVDCKILAGFSDDTEKLYRQLLRYPQEMIPIMDLVVHEEFCHLFGDESLPDGRRIQVRVCNLHEVKRMRALNPEDIDQLVTVRGMVIRTSQIIPDLKQAFFRCALCNSDAEVLIDRGKIEEPSKCANETCNGKWSMELIHNRSLYADKQMIKLQETPENVPEGETPHTVVLYAYDDLVDVAKPGDRVDVTGVLRAVPVRANVRSRVVHSVYKMHLDVLHFKKTKSGRVSAESSSAGQDSEFHTSFNEDGAEVSSMQREKVAKFRAMSTDPLIYEKLAKSVAPSIWEMDDVKKGILCQLFGGTNKETGDPNVSKSMHRMRARGELNILLCGDPGTSKSQLLSYVHKVAPRGIYTSGKGSSAVGLTAYITKDPDTKEMILESGALVLSDRGVCCIDEFDKMNDSTRAILHECMEQQTISIAKAGIIATLNARTSVLASANPVDSRYNPRLSIVQNIDLPPTLLSRFDLIYLILDKPDVARDRRLAKHLVSLYYEEPPKRASPIPAADLAEYISYAKEHCHPQISDAAAHALVEGYVELRQAGAIGGGRKTITATPRQLESLVRLSEALARVRLQDMVEESHVAEALRLMHVATQRAAMDPRTGTIDMDAINTGVGALERAATIQLAEAVLERIKAEFSTSGVSVQQLVRVIGSQSSVPVDAKEVMNAIDVLVEDSNVEYIPRTGVVRLL